MRNTDLPSLARAISLRLQLHLLIPFQQFDSLALNHILPPEHIGEDWWKNLVFEF